MMTILRDLGMTLLYGAPLGITACFAAYYLTKRLRAGGVWPLLIGFGLHLAATLIFDWQTRSFTGGRAITGGLGGFSIFTMAAAEAVSTRPLLFKKAKPHPTDTKPEKRVRDERAKEPQR